MIRSRSELTRRAIYGGSAGALALAATGHGLPALAITAAAFVLNVAIPALAKEVFWLRALSAPRRDLIRLIRLTGSLEAAERLTPQLDEARRQVVDARVHRDHVSRRGSKRAKH